MGLPVKVLPGTAGASQLVSLLLVCRAVGKWNMPVGDLVEEVDFILLQHQGCCYRVDGSVAPSFVEEAAILIKMLKVFDVSVGSQPVQIADFEIGPLYVKEWTSEMPWSSVRGEEKHAR
jgi:hypothetical protein